MSNMTENMGLKWKSELHNRVWPYESPQDSYMANRPIMSKIERSMDTY